MILYKTKYINLAREPHSDDDDDPSTVTIAVADVGRKRVCKKFRGAEKEV
jgi:hypothetical protein